tara:strand:- start:9 stop:206 length:198 start_codon:yes stop_codon:yes gene_type:complete
MSKELNQQIGRLEASVLELQKSTDELNEDVKAMSAQMHKWGGYGAGLMLLGAVVGWFGTIYFTTK